MDISSPEKLIIANRRRRVVELRVSGQTLESAASVISVEFELPNYNRSRAHEDFIAALAKVNKLTSTEINAHRKIEEMRLDFMWSKLLPAIVDGEVKAIDTGTKLCRAKSQLLGLDAATQNVIKNSVKEELISVLDQLQMNLDAQTYDRVLQIIAGRADEPDDQDETITEDKTQS